MQKKTRIAQLLDGAGRVIFSVERPRGPTVLAELTQALRDNTPKHFRMVRETRLHKGDVILQHHLKAIKRKPRPKRRAASPPAVQQAAAIPSPKGQLIQRTARLVGPDGATLATAETHASSTNPKTLKSWFHRQFRVLLGPYSSSHTLVFTTKVNGTVAIEGRLEAKPVPAPRAPKAAKPLRVGKPKDDKAAAARARTARRKAYRAQEEKRRKAKRAQAKAQDTAKTDTEAAAPPKPTAMVAKAPGSKPRRKKAPKPHPAPMLRSLELVFWLIITKNLVPLYPRILTGAALQVVNTSNATIRKALVKVTREMLGTTKSQLLGFELDSQRGIIHALVRTEPSETRGSTLRAFLANPTTEVQASVLAYQETVQAHAARALKRRKARRRFTATKEKPKKAVVADRVVPVLSQDQRRAKVQALLGALALA